MQVPEQSPRCRTDSTWVSRAQSAEALGKLTKHDMRFLACYSSTGHPPFHWCTS